MGKKKLISDLIDRMSCEERKIETEDFTIPEEIALTCWNCGSEVVNCVMCGTPFTVGSEMSCYRRERHYCYDCYLALQGTEGE